MGHIRMQIGEVHSSRLSGKGTKRYLGVYKNGLFPANLLNSSPDEDLQLELSHLVHSPRPAHEVFANLEDLSDYHFMSRGFTDLSFCILH